MKNNVLLFILVLVISLATASYFGGLYDIFDAQYGGGWMADKEMAVNLAGFIFAYVFFIPFVFELLSKRNKNKWMIWSLVPVILLYIGYNWQLLYIPIIASIVGCLLAKLINFVISKLKHSNPPMVINK